MKIVIHRGTHQIGGIAAEIRTETTRILIDMGDELSLQPGFVSAPLDIPGVTDDNGHCDAVLFTHYHGDHTGQMTRIRKEIPLYAGALAKEIMITKEVNYRSKDPLLLNRLQTIHPFNGGDVIMIGDLRITPWSIDHSACDSYMFLIEAEGTRILYTGDFRMHGFRGKFLPKILHKIGPVDVLITEGTTLSRPNTKPMTERELQQKVKNYMEQYKYVYVLCPATNLERICALSKAVPPRKYFICDKYQKALLKLVEQHWGHHSSLYRNIKKTHYGDNILEKMKEKGFLMAVRDTSYFRTIIRKFDPEQGIILYSMWDGYRTKPGSTIPSFLNLVSRWEPLHTSGHASHDDLKQVIEQVNPGIVIPMHSDDPDQIRSICPNAKVLILNDKEEFSVPH